MIRIINYTNCEWFQDDSKKIIFRFLICPAKCWIMKLLHELHMAHYVGITSIWSYFIMRLNIEQETKYSLMSQLDEFLWHRCTCDWGGIL